MSIVPSLMAKVTALETDLAAERNKAVDQEGVLAEAAASVAAMHKQVDQLTLTLARIRNEFFLERKRNDDLERENKLLRNVNSELNRTLNRQVVPVTGSNPGASPINIPDHPAASPTALLLPSTNVLDPPKSNPFLSMADLLPRTSLAASLKNLQPYDDSKSPSFSFPIEQWLKTDSIRPRMPFPSHAVTVIEHEEFSGQISESPEFRILWKGEKKGACEFEISIVAKKNLFDLKILPEPFGSGSLIIRQEGSQGPMLMNDKAVICGSFSFVHAFENSPVVCFSAFEADTKRPVVHYCQLPILYGIFCESSIKLDTVAVLNTWENGQEFSLVVPKVKSGVMNLIRSLGGAFTEVHGLDASKNARIFYSPTPENKKGIVARIELGSDVRVFGTARIAVRTQDALYVAKCVAKGFACLIGE